MFNSKSSELHAKLAALDRSQAVIEFKMDGTIVTANSNFLGAVGYGLEEIKNKHTGCSSPRRSARAPAIASSGTR